MQVNARGLIRSISQNPHGLLHIKNATIVQTNKKIKNLLNQTKLKQRPIALKENKNEFMNVHITKQKCTDLIGFQSIFILN